MNSTTTANFKLYLAPGAQERFSLEYSNFENLMEALEMRLGELGLTLDIVFWRNPLGNLISLAAPNARKILKDSGKISLHVVPDSDSEDSEDSEDSGEEDSGDEDVVVVEEVAPNRQRGIRRFGGFVGFRRRCGGFRRRHSAPPCQKRRRLNSEASEGVGRCERRRHGGIGGFRRHHHGFPGFSRRQGVFGGFGGFPGGPEDPRGPFPGAEGARRRHGCGGRKRRADGPHGNQGFGQGPHGHHMGSHGFGHHGFGGFGGFGGRHHGFGGHHGHHMGSHGFGHHGFGGFEGRHHGFGGHHGHHMGGPHGFGHHGFGGFGRPC
ncbi:hypothetical protein L3Y34_009555 [Caenorhabditis briggsae]|nr:hypothetical protein L3Y34_009555 [Caenorhabditis briggsae]